MEFTIDILQTDEEGIKFYLEYYKPFRLLALQLSPEGKCRARRILNLLRLLDSDHPSHSIHINICRMVGI